MAAFELSAWQREFLSLDVHEALGAGSAGPGKTTCLRCGPLEQLRVEHSRCRLDPNEPEFLAPGTSMGWWLYLRRTNAMLVQEIERTEQLYRAVCPRVRWKEDVSGGRTYTFPPSGYKVQLAACCDPGDYHKFMSNEYTGVAFDEGVQFTEEQWDQITSRVRTSDPVLRSMRKRLMMSNPMMELEGSTSFVVTDPDWVRRRFVDPAPEGRKILTRRMRMDDGSIDEWTYIYLPARLSDNPDPQFKRDYELTLKTKPYHMVQALLRGDWYVTVGGFFSDALNEDVHVCRPFRIPRHWSWFRALDWGFKTHGVCLWIAVDPEDNWVVAQELTFKGLQADEVAREMRAIEVALRLWDYRAGRSLLGGPSDPQLWEERGDVGKTKAEVFEEAGFSWVRADKDSRRAGEIILGKLGDMRGGVPGLQFFDSCRRTFNDLKMIRCDLRDRNKPLDTRKNHWFDALKYAANYASRGTDAMFSERDEDERPRIEALRMGRGRTGYGF